MRYLTLLIGMFLTEAAVYAEPVFPVGCQALVVDRELLKVSTEKATLTFLHNRSKMDLWITHPVTESSAGWSSRLQSGNWSALILNSESFELSCIESKPGHEQQVPCAGVLSACQWSDITMPQKKPKLAWAGEDMSLSELMSHVGSKGFVLPTAANK